MKKPVIGVMPLWDEEKDSIWMLPGYLEGVRQAGGLPVIFPLTAEERELTQLLALCEGFLFTGGHDVSPRIYREEPQAGARLFQQIHRKTGPGSAAQGHAGERRHCGHCAGNRQHRSRKMRGYDRRPGRSAEGPVGAQERIDGRCAGQADPQAET